MPDSAFPQRKSGMFAARESYHITAMKKKFSSLILLCSLLPALGGCSGADYSSRISESRSDLFCAETEDFTLTLACVSREYPYIADGVPCTRSDYVEVVLSGGTADDYEVQFTVAGKSYGGEMSFRNVTGDYFFSQGVSEFPEGSVSVNVACGGETQELTATSVKTADTLTVDEALSAAVQAEQETIDEMGGRNFAGEFYVRLLRREKNYYYVGIIDTAGKTVSLLLDAESGEVLARRVTEGGR